VTAQAQKLFTKKVDGQPIDRGIAFPVCVSVNDIVCNHSPLAADELVRQLLPGSKKCSFVCFGRYEMYAFVGARCTIVSMVWQMPAIMQNLSCRFKCTTIGGSILLWEMYISSILRVVGNVALNDWTQTPLCVEMAGREIQDGLVFRRKD